VRRKKNTASDKDLEVVEETDLDALLSLVPHCADVVTTGQKASCLFAAHFGLTPPKVGFSVSFKLSGRAVRLWRMPSSSRAYPMNITRKAEFYHAMLGSIYALPPLSPSLSTR